GHGGSLLDVHISLAQTITCTYGVRSSALTSRVALMLAVGASSLATAVMACFRCEFQHPQTDSEGLRLPTTVCEPRPGSAPTDHACVLRLRVHPTALKHNHPWMCRR